MIRETIDVYLSFVDKKKIGLMLELWCITFLTAAAGHAAATSGDRQWDPLDYVVAWLGFFVVMDGLIPLLNAIFTRRVLGQILHHLVEKEREPARQMPRPSGRRLLTYTFQRYRDDPVAFWDVWEDADGVRPGERPSPGLSEPSWEEPELFWPDLGDDDEGAPPAGRFLSNRFDPSLNDHQPFWDDREDDEEVPYE